MSFSTRSIFAACAAIALTTACGSDSTGPTAAQQASAAALHWDSLYTQAVVLAGSDENFGVREQVASYLEIPAAFGAAPTSVTVTTGAGTEHWKGYILGDHESGGDSLYLLAMYRDSNAHDVFLAIEDAENGQLETAALVSNDTVVVQPDSIAMTTSQTSTGASCTLQAGLSNPQLAEGFNGTYTCNLAKFNNSLYFTSSATAGVDPALEHLSWSTKSFNGARVVITSEPGNRVHQMVTMLRALKAAKHK